MSDTPDTLTQALLDMSTAVVNQTAAVRDLVARVHAADPTRIAQVRDMISVVQASTDALVALAATLPPNPTPVPQPPEPPPFPNPQPPPFPNPTPPIPTGAPTEFIHVS